MKKKTSQSSKKDRTRNDKGIILEQIVAMLHEVEGVKVEKNVKLTPKSGDETRKREIDVLLTSEITGYETRVAIQCKNYDKPITIGQIGEFRDLLEDANIPLQHGIIVSINGYQSGATQRAKELGIKALVLEGLDKTRLKKEIKDTFQYFIHLLLIVENIYISTKVSKIYAYFFWDENKQLCGLLTDLIVSKWRNGEIPLTLGEYPIKLKLPVGWYQILNEELITPESMSADVRVVAYVAEMKGKLEEYKLKEADSDKIERFHTKADFDVINNLIKTTQEEPIFTEKELEKLKKGVNISVENRIRLPKIFVFNHFEPINEKAFNFVMKDAKNISLEEINKLPIPTIEEMEGDSPSPMQEPGVMGEPVIVENENGELIDVRLLAKQSRFSEIVKLFPLLQKYPRNDFAKYLSTAFYFQGKSALIKSKDEEPDFKGVFESQAFNMFRKAIQLSSKPIEMCLTVGLSLGKNQFYERAVEYFKKVVLAQPKNDLARYYLAQTFVNMGNLDDAANLINETTKLLKPIPTKILMLAVKIYNIEEQHQEAGNTLINIWQNDSKGVIENEFWHQLILDVYDNYRVLGTLFILCELNLYYVDKFIHKSLQDKLKETFEFVVSNLEEIHNLMNITMDEEAINEFYLLLSKANKKADELNEFYPTNAWQDRLSAISEISN